VIDEAGCLRITLAADIRPLDHWRELETMTDITS
jgi:hypothetical protein